jgi:hypothetical protein
MIYSPLAIRLLAESAVGVSSKNDRGFRSHFGCSSDVCSVLWQMMAVNRPNGMRPTHLLWALLFLKTYSTEDVLAERVGTTRKTYRKWVWTVVELIQALKPRVVSCFVGRCCFSAVLHCCCRRRTTLLSPDFS